MKEKIQEQLRRIEEAENIKILLAVESGSRAWGFASPDSDYDVRFIYIRRLEDYLRLDAIRDVIELPIDDVLDINGWDLQVLEFDSVLAWLPIEKTEIDIKELWWNPEYRLISIIYDSIMVFAKDTDNYLTMEYYGGNEGKIIFYMDVQTGNILENDKNRKEEIYYLQSTLRAWYSDMREKLLEGYQNGKFTILPEWDEQG